MKVSIIIPHFNNIELLDSCLNALQNQTVERSSYEIILVDNGTVGFDSLRYKSKVDVVLEYFKTQDPYNCRNEGILVSKSNYIALLDSKCIPESEWLECGLKKLEEGNSLVAGHIIVTGDSNLYQKAYGLIYLDNYHLNQLKAGFPTGNLFFNKDIVLDKAGLFQTEMRSGEDIRWTKSIIDKGLLFAYSECAKVKYRAKDKGQTIRDAIRDGGGLRKTGQSLSFRHFIPMNPEIFRQKLLRSNFIFSLLETFQIYFYFYLIRLSIVFGYFTAK